MNKICDNKKMKTTPWQVKIFITLLSNSIGDFLAPGAIIDNEFEKKNASFLKFAKIRDV